MDLYCKKEKLDGENKWFNEKTNEKQEANRGIIFWSLPEILIIDLKRWNGYTKKLNTLIETPLNDVDFSTYVKGYNSSSYIYDLYGVCNHSGGVSGGHYTSYVKNANGKWYEFNDTRVNEITEASVISQKSYCFFYRKK
jgi:ubiquitin C-terminal hydrolase